MAPATLRAWLATAGLAAGVLGAYHHVPFCFGVALGAAAAAGVRIRRHPRLRLLAISACCVALGIVSVGVRASRPSAVTVMARTVPRCSGEGEVEESLGGLGSLVVLRAASCVGFRPISSAGRVVVDDLGHPPGTTFQGTFRLLPLSATDDFDEARARIGAAARLDPLDVTYASPTAPLPRFAEAARSTLRRSTAPWGQGGALVMGLTIGDTSGLGVSTIEDFRRSGLSHLVAVSGSNLAIVLGAVAVMMQALGHRLRIAGAGLAIAVFILVVGPQPSVLRAAGMGAVGLAAVGWGRRSEPLLSLALGMFVVIAWRPALIYSVGLQLSAAATGGIVLWTRPVSARLRRLPVPIRVALAATLSAQFAVAPLLIATFGQLSLISPLANLVAFPAVAPATVLGIAGGALTILPGPLGPAIGRIASVFAGWILVVATRLGEVSWAAADMPRWAALPVAIPVVVAVLHSVRPRREEGDPASPATAPIAYASDHE